MIGYQCCSKAKVLQLEYSHAKYNLTIRRGTTICSRYKEVDWILARRLSRAPENTVDSTTDSGASNASNNGEQDD